MNYRKDEETGRPETAARSRDRSRLAVLKYRDFRLLWSGELLSMIGTQMQLFAVNWQVLELLRGKRFALDLAEVHVSLASDALGLGGSPRRFPPPPA